MSESSKTQTSKTAKKGKKQQKREARLRKAEAKKETEQQAEISSSVGSNYQFLSALRVAGITLVLYLLFGTGFAVVLAFSLDVGAGIYSAFTAIALQWPIFLTVYAGTIWGALGTLMSLLSILILIAFLISLARDANRRLFSKF